MGSYCPPADYYRNKPRVRIDPMMCTTCMRCVHACTRGDVLGAQKVGDRTYAVVKKAENCAGCFRCVNGCLTNAIHVYKV